MEELSIEQKAKYYDEAIKRLEDIKTGKCQKTFVFTEGLFEYIFPELVESGDERIRKKLIKETKGSEVRLFETVTNDEFVAWLEKQGKNNMGISEATKQELEDNLNKALEKETPESLNEFLEKQGEQKPTEEYNITGIGSKHAEGKLGEIIKNLKPVNKVLEQNSAWSAEDENMLRRAIIAIDCLWYKTSDDKQYYQNISDWLKTLKGRVQPQPKQEWSEEDKKMHDFALRAIRLCKQYAINNQINDYSKLPDIPQKYEELYQWLKNRYTWKPSDEQMHYLYWIANIKLGDSVVEQEVSKHLNELYKDLKKLMEE